MDFTQKFFQGRRICPPRILVEDADGKYYFLYAIQNISKTRFCLGITDMKITYQLVDLAAVVILFQ